jgi:tRNA(fMet)-specific endonuclease VapC
MGVLIDASVLIEYERGRMDLESRLTGHEEEEFFLSVITASELLHGVHRARDSTTRSRRAVFVESVLERFPILPIDLATARIHSQLSADLATAGTLIGPHDLWLAATALAQGLALVTANLREFKRVPGLGVESW